jgi:hypothetical protein
MSGKPILIGLTGKAGSGKDLVARLVDEEFVGWHVHRIAFADRLKLVCATMMNEEPLLYYDRVTKELPVQTLGGGIPPTRRQILQVVGVTMRKIVSPDVWVAPTLHPIKLADDMTIFVVTDVRFPNEARAISALGGAIVRVERITSLTNWCLAYGVTEDEWPDRYAAREPMCYSEFISMAKKLDIARILKIAEHESETAMDECSVDATILNDCPPSLLRHRVKTMVCHVKELAPQ